METPMPTRVRPLLISAAAAVALIAALALPASRAAAQTFLDLFRIVNVAAVPVNPDRLKQLSASGIDIATLIGSHVEVVADPGPVHVFSSPEEAGRTANVDVR